MARDREQALVHVIATVPQAHAYAWIPALFLPRGTSGILALYVPTLPIGASQEFVGIRVVRDFGCLGIEFDAATCSDSDVA